MNAWTKITIENTTTVYFARHRGHQKPLNTANTLSTMFAQLSVLLCLPYCATVSFRHALQTHEPTSDHEGKAEEEHFS